MNARNARNWTITQTGRLTLVLMLLVTMASLSGPALADDTPNATPVSGSAATVVGETATATPPADEATEVPTASATTSDPSEATPTDVVEETPTNAAAPDDVAETPEPAPSLTFKPRPAPVCAPLDDESQAVEANGSIDYACTYAIKLTGERIAPDWIAIDWSVSVTVTDSWSAQLSLTPDDPNSWTSLDAAPALIRVQTGWQPDASSEVADEFNNSAVLSFWLRLHRPACSETAPKVALTLAATATLPSHDDAVVAQAADQPKPFSLTPELAPLSVSEPVVSIANFAIAPVAFSLTDQVTTGSVTIAVDNPAAQCRNWNVLVDVQSFIGAAVDGPVQLSTIGPIDGSPDGVAAAPPAASDLDGPYVVAVIHAGTQPGQWTQTLGFNLTIPGQTSSGGYQSRATASVVPQP